VLVVFLGDHLLNVHPLLSATVGPICPVLSVTLVYVGVFWLNGWTDQDRTWHAGKPRSRPHCVRWEPNSTQKWHSPPIFGMCKLWTNSGMDQDATWYGGRPQPRRLCVRWGPSSPPPKRGTAPNFRHLTIVAKCLDGSRCHLVWR